jgi:hypothetical protein
MDDIKTPGYLSRVHIIQLERRHHVEDIDAAGDLSPSSMLSQVLELYRTDGTLPDHVGKAYDACCRMDRCRCFVQHYVLCQPSNFHTSPCYCRRKRDAMHQVIIQHYSKSMYCYQTLILHLILCRRWNAAAPRTTSTTF